MLKINLITDEIKPFLKEKSSPIKANVKKIVFIIVGSVLLLSVIAYFLGKLFLSSIQDSGTEKFVQDDSIALEKPADYERKEAVEKIKEEEISSDKDTMKSRKNSENNSLPPSKKEEINSKKSSSTILEEDSFVPVKKTPVVTKKATKKVKKSKKKRYTSKKVTLSSSRVENFIVNEHSTPLTLLASLSGVESIRSMRLNNPQTIYLEVERGTLESVKSEVVARGLRVKVLKSDNFDKLIVSNDKTSGSPTIASITSIPDIEKRISVLVRDYGGYPVLKDNSKPIGKYFSYTVKYVIPKIEYNEILRLLGSVSGEYEAAGVSKIVYNNITKELKVDISMYGK